MASYTNVANNGIPPKIILYTNHRCPYAQRVHIVLKELGLPYEEVFVDLDKPREQWYLEINPRGLVPSIKYSNDIIEDEIITESAIVAQFLLDAHPSHVLPVPIKDPKAPLVRARISYFTDSWNNKVASYIFKLLKEEDTAQQDTLAKEFVAVVEKEIEPLLKDADPFFGRSKELTFAEVLIAPFLLRTYAYAKAGLYPASWKEGLDKLPNFSKWVKATTTHPSVTQIWDEENIVKKTVERFKLKAKA